MVWYDVVVLAILAYAAWQGAQRGLVTQLAWIGALVLCFKFADELAPVIEPSINVEQPLRHWIAMFVLYLGFSLAAFMGARILDSWLEKAKFKDFDRHLGGLFGLLKGAIFVLVATFFAVTLSESLKATVLKSYTGYGACVILDKLEPITPQYFPEYFQEYIDRYQQELDPLHQQHGELGTGSSSIADFFGEESGPPSSGDQGQGGFDLPDLIDSLSGRGGSGRSDPADSSGIADGPTLDELWRQLPQSVTDQFGDQIQQQWSTASPSQRRQLIDNLSRSFDFQIPDVVSNFLSSSNTENGGQSGSSVRSDFRAMLEEIGDIYKDRNLIVQRTSEHLAGIPVRVQEAVIRDWYADLSMQVTDPDPGTSVQTRLDERILRQLERARIPLSDLSFDLRQRLNLSRQ